MSPRRWGLGPSHGVPAAGTLGEDVPADEHALRLGERAWAWLSWSLGGGVIRASARERMRPRAAAAWLGGAFLVASLAFVEVFFALGTQAPASALGAARNAFRTVFVLQACVLLLLGTGSVAAGLARQRESGVLDYLRLSPLHLGSKILGLLLGLPIREYAMVAATLPLAAVAAWLGRLPMLNVLELYLALLMAAWLYHASGLVAGLVAGHPWRAGWLAGGLIVALYVLVLCLSELGLTTAGYVTILPAFDALLSDSLGYYAVRVGGRHGVEFCVWTLPPVAYTLLVQGWFLGLSLYVVRRKWQARQAFSKIGGLGWMATLLLLVVGSLWPYLAAPPNPAIVGPVGLHAHPYSVEAQWAVTLYAYSLVTGLGFLVVLGGGTPAPVVVMRSLRRVRRHGRRRIRWTEDGAPGLGWALAVASLGVLGYLGLLALSVPAGGLVWDAGPGRHLVHGLLLGGVALQVHAAAAARGRRGLLALVGLGWLLPLVLGTLLARAFGAPLAGAYSAVLSPAGAFGVALLGLFQPAFEGVRGLAPIRSHLPGLQAAALFASLGPALVVEVWLWRSREGWAHRLGAGRSDFGGAEADKADSVPGSARGGGSRKGQG